MDLLCKIKLIFMTRYVFSNYFSKWLCCSLWKCLYHYPSVALFLYFSMKWRHDKLPLLKHEASVEYAHMCISGESVFVYLFWERSWAVGVWYVQVFCVTCFLFLCIFFCLFSFFTTQTSHTSFLIKNGRVVQRLQTIFLFSFESEEYTQWSLPSRNIDETFAGSV